MDKLYSRIGIISGIIAIIMFISPLILMFFSSIEKKLSFIISPIISSPTEYFVLFLFFTFIGNLFMAKSLVPKSKEKARDELISKILYDYGKSKSKNSNI